MVRGAGVRLAVVALAVCLAACGGGGEGEPSTGPTSVAATGSPTTRPSGPVVNATTRGCHRKRTGEADIQFSFSILERSAVENYAGELEFHLVAVTDPASWSTVDGAPEVIDRPHNEIFHLLVPAGEPIPPEMTLHAEAETADQPVQTFDLQPDAILAIPVGVCTSG
jgi:hypothetical protein